MNEARAKYWDALEGVGPKVVEIILDRAAHDKDISLEDLLSLCRKAYPDDFD